MQRITWVLTLSEAILCKKDVLGRKYKCLIGGISAYIYFPQYTISGINCNNDSGRPLENPLVGTKVRNVNEQFDWGYVFNSPNGDCYVERLVLVVNYEIGNEEKISRIIYESIDCWEKSFVDYINLLVKKNTYKIECERCCLDLIEGAKTIDKSKPLKIHYNIQNMNSTPASIDMIRKSIRFANSGKQLLLEYQMLLSAYEARQTYQNRRAIIDACASFELSVVNEIKKCFKTKRIPETLLDKRFFYLGERIDLLLAINNSIPKLEYKKRIIDSRNSLLHNKDIYPSNDTVNELISCVEEYLDSLNQRYY